MVGQQTLNLFILVRVQVWRQSIQAKQGKNWTVVGCRLVPAQGLKSCIYLRRYDFGSGLSMQSIGELDLDWINYVQMAFV